MDKSMFYTVSFDQGMISSTSYWDVA